MQKPTNKKVQFARIWTAYKIQYFHNQNTVSVLPVFRSSLKILRLISRLVFISSQPQTPLLKGNLTKPEMLCNTVRLCTHFINYHFARKTLHALLYFHAALEFVRVTPHCMHHICTWKGTSDLVSTNPVQVRSIETFASIELIFGFARVNSCSKQPSIKLTRHRLIDVEQT